MFISLERLKSFVHISSFFTNDSA